MVSMVGSPKTSTGDAALYVTATPAAPCTKSINVSSDSLNVLSMRTTIGFSNR
jgi:hypothetical protein